MRKLSPNSPVPSRYRLGDIVERVDVIEKERAYLVLDKPGDVARILREHYKDTLTEEQVLVVGMHDGQCYSFAPHNIALSAASWGN